MADSLLSEKPLHKCEFCEITFIDKRYLVRHIKTMHSDKNPTFKYEICDLTGQETEHVKEKPNKCEICYKEISTPIINREGVLVTKPRKCTVCEKKFSEEYRLSLQNNARSRKKPHKVCDKTSTNKYNLKQQRGAVHSGEKLYKCKACDKIFTSQRSLNGHLAIHSEITSSEFCSGTFSDEHNFICEICHKKFSKKRSLNGHLACHSEVKSFYCDFCHETFPDRFSLAQHKSSHFQQKPHQCEICGHRFTTTRGLSRHAFFFHSAKYKCEMCGQSFSDESSFKTHKMKHFEQKPYRCNTCGEVFYHWMTFKKHQATHSEEDKPTFQCLYCDKSFTSKAGVAMHCKEDHKNMTVLEEGRLIPCTSHQFS